MTTFRLPPTERERLRAALRAHAEQWIKRFYRHEILVARAVRGIQNDASAEFLRTVAEPIIRQVAAGLAGFEQRGQDVLIDQSPQLRRLMAEVRQQVQRAVLELQRTTKAAIKDLVGQETAWVTESAEKVLRLGQVRPVSLPAIEDAVDRRPYLGGKTEEWFGSLVDGDNGVVDNVRFAVQTGVQRGLSTDEITRTLRGTKAGGFEDGLLTGANDTQVRAMVRTAASHASATARMETFKQLGVDRYQFVATLDSRTSIQCAANDGKTFPLGEGPMPPLHPNCRSTVIPYTGDEPIGNRASVNGPVPAGTNFRGWLEDQPQFVQDEVLGKTRAAAWRAGDLTFEQMVGRDMMPLSIQQLRDLDRIPNPEDEDE
jgi:SPP1 gp7 family putative phage head morphogenesis protein